MANNSPVIRPREVWGGPSQEDQALRQAVELSLQDVQPQHNNAPPSVDGLQAQGHRLILTLNNQFAPLEDPLGDTAIYIGPPPVMPGQNSKDYNQICQHFDRLYIVQSANLRLMGENSKFTKLLGPMSVRAERQIRKTGVLVMPEAKRGGKFKYYINLRPPTEDDEAVILTTELSCTNGVLTWSLAKPKYDLSPLSVMGHDELFPMPGPPKSKDNSAGKEAEIEIEQDPFALNVKNGLAGTNLNTAKPIKNLPIGPDYSILRHWSAIERLLQAIQGNDPKLDSAPKVWTYFAVARYFGCAQHERVSGWITTWMCTQNNANFIQCNPEVAYRIGLGIESAELIRDAFSILVGERALIDAYGEYNPKILNPLKASVHGRKLDLLDEDERNRIDHAASSLVSRIRQVVCMLCRDMDWLRESTDYMKLETLRGRSDAETQAINEARDEVRDYIRSRIYYVLCQSQTKHQLEPDTPSTACFRAGTSETYPDIYNSLNQPMRMFTQTFWHALSRTRFDIGMYNTSPEGTVGDRSSTRYYQALKKLYDEDPMNGIRSIRREHLDLKIAAVNRILFQRQIDANDNNQSTSSAVDFGSSASRAPESNHLRRRDGQSDYQNTLPQNTNPLNPEFINLSSLAISGHSRHGSDEAGPSTQIPFSPSKRRKTIIADDNIQDASDWSSWRDFVVEPPSDEDSISKSTDSLIPRKTTDGAGAIQGSMFALPIRERHTSAVNIGQDGLKRQLDSSNADEPPSTSPIEEPFKLPEARIGTTSGTDLGKQFPDNTDKLPAPVFDPHPDYPQVPTTEPDQEAAHGDPFSPEHNGSCYWPGIDPDLSSSSPTTFLTTFTRISPGRLLDSATHSVQKICSTILHPPHLFHATGLLPTDLFDTLTCLDDSEFKYLPLWAGGNDDGTGGVFDDFPVPNLDAASQDVEGFGPGRIRKAYDAPSSISDAGTTSNDSGFDFVASSQALSTVGKASKRATDGIQTVVSLSSAASDAVESDAPSVVHVSAEVEVEAEADPFVKDDGMDSSGISGDIGDDDIGIDLDEDMEVEIPDRSDDEEDFDDTDAGEEDGDAFMVDHEPLNTDKGKGKEKERETSPAFVDEDDSFDDLKPSNKSSNNKNDDNEDDDDDDDEYELL